MDGGEIAKPSGLETGMSTSCALTQACGLESARVRTCQSDRRCLVSRLTSRSRPTVIQSGDVNGRQPLGGVLDLSATVKPGQPSS